MTALAIVLVRRHSSLCRLRRGGPPYWCPWKHRTAWICEPLADQARAEVEERRGQHAEDEHRCGVQAERDAHARLALTRRHARRRIEVHQLHDAQIVERA